MSYDAAIYLYDPAGCQNDTAGCQNDAAKPHFEGSQDTWMHGFLHVWLSYAARQARRPSAASRLKKAKIGNLGTSIELNADFSDLYSFCDINLLKKHVKVACELAGFNTNTVDYINNLIFVEMNRSYFCEPTGVFRTTQGFSMGDNAICAESRASKYPGCLQNVALQRHFDILQRHIDIWQRHMTSGSVIQSV